MYLIDSGKVESALMRTKVLSSFQIDKGERILKEINQILKVSEEEVCSNPKLEALSSQFYTTIPHNIGMSLSNVIFIFLSTSRKKQGGFQQTSHTHSCSTPSETGASPTHERYSCGMKDNSVLLLIMLLTSFRRVLQEHSQNRR